MMGKYGSWSTFDAPIENEEEAFRWLSAELKKIDALVFIKYNSHELKSYPSFEVNAPAGFSILSEDICEDMCEVLSDSCNECSEFDEREDIISKLNAIETAFSEKFHSDE